MEQGASQGGGRGTVPRALPSVAPLPQVSMGGSSTAFSLVVTRSFTWAPRKERRDAHQVVTDDSPLGNGVTVIASLSFESLVFTFLSRFST